MYDYIVVGAGSAGSIVASKLAAFNSSIKILLIEAGGIPFANQMYLASDWFEVLQKYPEIEWEGYQSSPQAGLNNRVIKLQQAKVLGGCSLHNATVYVRGSRSDFNEWGKVTSGWSWDDVLPHFENVEQTMKVLVGEADDFINDLFAAAKEYGLPENLNYNTSESQYGYSLFRFNNTKRASDLLRETTFDTYLANRPDNLALISQALVSRILFDKDAKAIGVEYIKGKEKHYAYVQNEIILTGCLKRG
ncbi:MAG: GMC family oxidoreductase [Cyanothece sp. SIO1E1]|nr:GMC family oxidoreductase [Cyanothece sp. SIO1E1]